MRTLKKTISVILLVIMTMVMTISTAAAAEPTGNESVGLHFLSKDVPDAAEDYGRFYFSRLTTDELLDLGFSFEEMVDLRLAPAVTAYEYDQCDDRYYYFPVMSGERVIAMLTMVDLDNGSYSVQFGKCKFAEGLNALVSNCDNPQILVICEDGMFALDQEDNFTLVDSYITESGLSRSRSLECKQPDLTFETASLTCNTSVLINQETVYDESINFVSPRLMWMAKVDVPFVANGSTDRYPGGYCWASSITSVIKYHGNTKTISRILNEVLATSIDGYDYEIKDLLNKYVDHTVMMLSGTGAMSMNEITKVINSGKPIYTDWQSFNESGAHAMVVRGVCIHDELVGPGFREYGTASIMDPNESTYQQCSLIPGQKYVKGTHSFSWYSSVY